MPYWLPHIAVAVDIVVDQLLQFLLLPLLCYCYGLLLLCARATLALFFKLTKTKCCPMQFAAVRVSAHADIHMCVCVCINCIFGQCNVLDLHIYALCITIFLRERERATFVCIAHSLAHTTAPICTYTYVCVCLICIQSDFQLTFEFCTFCNANVMLTASERTLSITMRALSFLSCSLCRRAVQIKCHACDKMINPEKRARELRPTGNRIINLNAWLDCAHRQAKKAITKQVQLCIPLVTN